ncbi:MAG: hypothetical protein C4533_04265 [Candidatus Omnitrophota bacterium]|nr:MAG: hypothetical protein C4533_04265 [Candidatus Omnitrophota bacterium]
MPIYSVDNNNRLIIKKPGSKRAITVNGRFKADKNNNLIYELNEPNRWRIKENLPSKIEFEGRWSLDKDHNLVFTVTGSKENGRLQRLVLKGDILAVNDNSLRFEIKTVEEKGVYFNNLGPDKTSVHKFYLGHFYLMAITGLWCADKKNRLTFEVATKRDSSIVLKNSWQLNDNQNISYSYNRRELKTKKKSYHEIAFDGFWSIDATNRLKYILADSRDSGLEFKVQLESPNLYPKDGCIKYRLGAGLSKKDNQYKIISIYGIWKLFRKTGLSFEVKYGDSQVKLIQFGSNFRLGDNNEIVIELLSKEGKSLGMKLNLGVRGVFGKDSRVFIKLQQLNSRDFVVTSGASINF